MIMTWVLIGLIAFIALCVIAFNVRNEVARKTPEQTAKSETKPDTTTAIKRTDKQ
jgi:Na+/melibiose symporter-like transporter